MEMKKYMRNNMNVFDKVEWVKQLTSEALGIENETAIRRMLSHLRRKGSASMKKYGVLKFTQQELILDQLLKANEVSPRAAYNWFILVRCSENVRDLGMQDLITQNEIGNRMKGLLRKSPEQEKLGKEILNDIAKIVGVM